MEKKVISEIKIPEGVNITVEGKTVNVQSGEKKTSRTIKTKGIDVIVEGDTVKILVPNERKSFVSTGITIGKHIENMILGVRKGFVYKLKINYAHFPIRAAVNGDVVDIENYVGRKQKIKSKIMPGAKVEVKGQDIIVSGISKEAVGQTAANMEEATKARRLCNRKFLDGIYLMERGVGK
ncbi:MAG: 50S ribosomal protein L6 [Candidatus Diapherotrites archaeon]|nr:50S ribosomal protein L6 [Candidatus Diapherotrites archaeon]